jgi:hypothetical protein
MKHYHRRRRVIRNQYGTVLRIAPRETGALAQCRFCQWGRFFRDNSRLRYSAMARAAASLREHIKLEHTDKLPKLWIPPMEASE